MIMEGFMEIIFSTELKEGKDQALEAFWGESVKY